MRLDTKRFPTSAALWVACAYFFLAGLCLIPLVGIENDEALFAQGLYQPRADYSIQIGRSHIPVMLMSYVGALKSLVYMPIFKVFGTGIMALRAPMLLAGTASIWLFYLLLSRIAGKRAALIGCALLAVDSGYLTTVCFDWGPVALQHLLTLGGALLLVRFYQECRLADLGCGFFLLGLALWDKALAVWLLSGMAVAGIVTLPRQIFDALTGRRVMVAALALFLGALPLLIYNLDNRWATFHGNLTRDTRDLPGKARFLMESEKKGLFGWLTAWNWQTPEPHEPHGLLQRASAGISSAAGHPTDFRIVYGFALALLLAPLAGRNGIRAILFSLIAMGVAWFQMAINAATGASLHHTILLWPLPELIIAVSFAAASRRLGRAGIPAIAVAMALLLASGVSVINEYYVDSWRFGGGQSWNDGIFPLTKYVREVPASHVICLDWGLMEPLRLLERGRLPLVSSIDLLSGAQISDEDRTSANWLLSDPSNLYVAHTPEFAFFPAPAPNLVAFAAKAGYRQRMMAVIPDSHGRKVYEVFRFEQAGADRSEGAER